MATMVEEIAEAPLTSANGAAAAILAFPQRVYSSNRDSAEQDLEMQSHQGLRSRHSSRVPRATTTEPESTSESEATLTPTSTIGSGETQAPQAKQSTFESLGATVGRFVDNLCTQALPTHSAPNRQLEYDRVKRKELKDSVNGLPRLAAFQNSGESFFQFRRYGDVATRILLTKQIELFQLVSKLEELDRHDAADYAKWGYRLYSIEHNEKWDAEQRELLQDIEEKLSKYYDFYLKFQNIRAHRTTEASDHRKVHDWVIENDPLVEEEKEYLFDGGDFMSSNKEVGGSIIHDSQVATALQNYTKKYPHSFLNGFLKERKEQENLDNPHAVIYFSKLRFRIATKIAIAALAVTVILIAVLSIWLGSRLSRGAMGGLVILFGVIFTGAILAVTSTALEIFMGITGFFAVVASVLAANYNPGNGTTTVAS